MLTFNGKTDTFVVQCTDHPDADLEANPTNSGSILTGKHVTCPECGASGLVYDDGGIYKLVDSDPSLSISVQ